MCCEEAFLILHFRLRDSTVEVCTHVLRLGSRRVVGVAADIQVVVVLPELLPSDHGCESGDCLERLVSAHDLLDVFRQKLVLGPPLLVFPIGINEEHLPTALDGLGTRRTQDKNARWDAGAVEEVRSEADDRVENVLIEETGTDLLLLATAEEHAMRHDRDHQARRAQNREHVLDEHQIRLLARLWAEPEAKALWKWDPVATVVLTEWGIGDDSVKTHELAGLEMLWAR